MRQALHFVEHNEFVGAPLKIQLGLAQFCPISRRLQIQVDTGATARDFVRECRLAYLTSPNKRHGSNFIEQFPDDRLGSPREDPCKLGV